MTFLKRTEFYLFCVLIKAWLVAACFMIFMSQTVQFYLWPENMCFLLFQHKMTINQFFSSSLFWWTLVLFSFLWPDLSFLGTLLVLFSAACVFCRASAVRMGSDGNIQLCWRPCCCSVSVNAPSWSFCWGEECAARKPHRSLNQLKLQVVHLTFLSNIKNHQPTSPLCFRTTTLI